MSVDVSWHDPERRIIRLDFEAPWYIEQALMKARLIKSMMDSVDYNVDFIVVANDVEFSADILKDFPRVCKEAPFSHPRMGRMLMVSSQWSLRVIWGIFSETYKPILFADSLEEAEEIINSIWIDLSGMYAV